MDTLRSATNKAALVLIAALLVSVFPITSADAQQAGPNNGGQALEIAPALITLNVSPGETTTVDLQLRNVSGEALLVNGEVNDFVASDESGTPRILMDEESQAEFADNPYSLRDWFAPLPQLLLEPQQIETFSAEIYVPENASPGGHYGIVRFSGSPPELEGTGVSLSASVGTLLLITVDGDISEEAQVAEFFVEKNGQRGTLFESIPLQLIQRIENSGNIHIQPTGQVKITDMFGRPVASANVNLARQNILPDSTRRFEQPIDSSLVGNRRFFGRYTAELILTYGEDQTVTSTITFWVIPYKLIGFIIGFLAILVLIGRFFLGRYKKRILSQIQTKQ